MRILFMLAFLIIMIFLDKKKILQYNKLPVFFIYLYISPCLVSALTAPTISTLFFAGLTLLAPMGGAMFLPELLILLLLSIVTYSFLVYILVRLCKNPVDEFKVKDSYDAACLRRITLYRRAALIPAVIIGLTVILFTIGGLSAVSTVSVFSYTDPSFIFFGIITFGVSYIILFLYHSLMALATIYVALVIGSMAVWLYFMYMVFSYVQLVRLYRLGEIDRKRLILWGIGLFFFPINLFMSPKLSKAAKRAAANCDEKYKTRQVYGITKENDKIAAAAAIWNDTKSTDTETTNS